MFADRVFAGQSGLGGLQPKRAAAKWKEPVGPGESLAGAERQRY